MKRPAIQELHFHNPRLSNVGVETLTVAELRQRANSKLLCSPQRVDFYHLLLVQEGRADHMVDFETHALRSGCVLLVRPGQVQQWRVSEQLNGQLLLISGEALSPSVARKATDMELLTLSEWPTVSTPSQGLFGDALVDVQRLAYDIRRFAGTDLEAAIIRHQLITVLLRLARELRGERAPPRNAEAKIYALFSRELEGTFIKRMSVLDYARRIGFSESTLSRACVAIVGRTAKQEIDRRVALEAKRLLVHSSVTAVEIAHQLGFTEPTNFVKFFRRNVGATPAEFRATHSAAG